MTRKLSWLVVVLAATALLFTACPVQFDPDAELDIGDEGDVIDVPADFSGSGTGSDPYGYHGPVTVTLIWVDGAIADVTIIQEEHLNVQHNIGFWETWLRTSNTFPPILPMIYPTPHPGPLNVFSGATISVNALTRAARRAEANRVADED